MEFASPTLVDSAVPSGQRIENFKELSVGAGTDVFKVNKEGVFAGGTSFRSSPWNLTFTGVMGLGTDTGSSIILDGNTGILSMGYNGTQYGTIQVDSSTNIIYKSNTNHQFFDASSNQLAVLSTSGLVLMDDVYLKFRNGTTLSDTGAYGYFDRTLGVNGDVFLEAGNKFQIGTTPGVTFSSGNVGGLFEMNAVGGIITYWNKF